MMKKSKIPTIVGLILLITGVASGVLLIQNRQIFRLRATPQLSPKDVRITNITDSSFTVSWVTDGESEGFIKWGENRSSLKNLAKDEISGKSFIHTITVRGLSPKTTYYFIINSNGSDFDNNGLAWETRTGPPLSTSADRNLISGTVLTSTGAPANQALVYVTLAGSSPLSATTSQNGGWLIPISSARTSDLSAFLKIDEQSTLIEVLIQAGPLGSASAQIYPQAAKPVPTIILGRNHDFRNLTPTEADDIPKATIELPEEPTPSSGFEVPSEIPTPSSETVTLESLDEGEVVTSTKPEFFGEGPPNTTLTITVESDPITDEITVGPSGSWNWSPPEGLSEGTHKITIAWRDASGILRTLTRTFIVQASEGPAFESTPSATPTSTPTPTPTTTPTASPSPTASPAASPSPVSTISADLDSGSLTPTFLLSIMGLGLIVFGGLLASMAFVEKNARRQ